MTDIIKVNNVSKSYGGVKANVDISMTVKQGSITGIIGPNGKRPPCSIPSSGITLLIMGRLSLTGRKSPSF